MILPLTPWDKFEALKGLWVPIISAPLAGVSGAELASSVAKGGGMGFVGSGFAKDKESLHRFGSQARLSHVRGTLSVPRC